jgi:hypothetical protein
LLVSAWGDSRSDGWPQAIPAQVTAATTAPCHFTPIIALLSFAAIMATLVEKSPARTV